MIAVANICIFCGSSNAVAQDYLDYASKLGRLCADARVNIIYGGGCIGLMGALADGAMDAGGTVIGVIPDFLNRKNIAHSGISEMVITSDIHQRKAKMAEFADAFVILPGSVGTLEEMFEVIAWKQLKCFDKPIILANVNGYWTPALALLDHMVRESFLSQQHLDLLHVVDHIDAVLPALGVRPVS
ncbi:MAG: TIGR00730 family Rossman fold protein [Rhodospirillaceae bacterium]|nr:TIGR00730 family Rossman fold protein [Rhodospirillaceae bacterium]